MVRSSRNPLKKLALWMDTCNCLQNHRTGPKTNCGHKMVVALCGFSRTGSRTSGFQNASTALFLQGHRDGRHSMLYRVQCIPLQAFWPSILCTAGPAPLARPLFSELAAVATAHAVPSEYNRTRASVFNACQAEVASSSQSRADKITPRWTERDFERCITRTSIPVHSYIITALSKWRFSHDLVRRLLFYLFFNLFFTAIFK